MSGFNNHLLSLGFASGGFTSGLLGSDQTTLEKSPNQGCQVFTTKCTQLLAQSHFDGGLPLKIASCAHLTV